MGKRWTRSVRVALSLAGSAILLFACAKDPEGDSAGSEESMMTEYSEDLSVVMSQNGRRSYHFVTPLLEGYSLAREPYREFRKGVKITTYKNDSLTEVDAVLTANYAIYYENRELWEAKGNVVVEKSDGKTLYTQQLFWNARTKKIYSNVDSKIVQNNGRDVFIGEGFESDEEFKDWRFRRMKGRMEVEMKQRADSAAADSAAVRPGPHDAAGRDAGPAATGKERPAATPRTDGRVRPSAPTAPRTHTAPGESRPAVVPATPEPEPRLLELPEEAAPVRRTAVSAVVRPARSAIPAIERPELLPKAAGPSIERPELLPKAAGPDYVRPERLAMAVRHATADALFVRTSVSADAQPVLPPSTAAPADKRLAHTQYGSRC